MRARDIMETIQYGKAGGVTWIILFIVIAVIMAVIMTWWMRELRNARVVVIRVDRALANWVTDS